MAKHPVSRRVHRQQHEEDVFVAAALESGHWAKTHGRTLTITIVALVVVAAMVLYYRNFSARRNDTAATELSGIRGEVMQGNQTLAAKDLTAFIKKYGSTPSANEARLLLAQVDLESNQAPAAISVIQPLAAKPNKSEGATAGLILGAAYEANKQIDKAEAAYLNVADKARFGFEKREALERAALLRYNRGDVAGAAQLYERAMNTLPPDSEERTVYKMRIAEVTAAGVKKGS